MSSSSAQRRRARRAWRSRSLDSAIPGCYCGGGRPSRIVQPHVIQSAPLRRALAVSVLPHGALGRGGWWAGAPERPADLEPIDIEIAPPAPKAEALPPEIARRRDEQLAQQGQEASEVPAPGEGMIDAG